MKYYIDCEFDGLNGPLLSMAIVSETGRSMYAVMAYTSVQDEWVREHVTPYMFQLPLESIDCLALGATESQLSGLLQTYFSSDMYPHVIADWPDDIKYLCAAMITGPGTMINVAGMKFSVRRVDAYPTEVVGAIQHNAWWDAQALWRKLALETKTGLLEEQRQQL